MKQVKPDQTKKWWIFNPKYALTMPVSIGLLTTRMPRLWQGPCDFHNLAAEASRNARDGGVDDTTLRLQVLPVPLVSIDLSPSDSPFPCPHELLLVLPVLLRGSRALGACPGCIFGPPTAAVVIQGTFCTVHVSGLQTCHQDRPAAHRCCGAPRRRFLPTALGTLPPAVVALLSLAPRPPSLLLPWLLLSYPTVAETCYAPHLLWTPALVARPSRRRK